MAVSELAAAKIDSALPTSFEIPDVQIIGFGGTRNVTCNYGVTKASVFFIFNALRREGKSREAGIPSSREGAGRLEAMSPKL